MVFAHIHAFKDKKESPKRIRDAKPLKM